MKRIIESFQIVTPESAVRGECSDYGWIDEVGESMEPNESETLDGITAVDLAVKYLTKRGAVNPSSEPFHVPGTWYSTDELTDYNDGTVDIRSFFLVDFSTDEAKAIYDQLT